MGITLERLIGRITDPGDFFDSDLLECFLITYRSHTNTVNVLEKLLIRYNTPPDVATVMDKNSFDHFLKTFLEPMRVRICQICKRRLLFIYNPFSKVMDEESFLWFLSRGTREGKITGVFHCSPRYSDDASWKTIAKAFR